MNNVASFGPGSLGCNPPTQEQMQLSQIISLLSTLACKDVASSLNLTTECLQVTVAGAWGEVGDIIQVIRWFDARQIPPTSFYTVYVNTVTNAVVTGVTTSNTTECPTGGDGPISINGIFNFEYFICDNGVQKIVQLCGASCSDYSVNYLSLDRTESTEPADWNLVTAGVCPIIEEEDTFQVFVELSDKTLTLAVPAGGVGVEAHITDVILSNLETGSGDSLLIRSDATIIGCVGVGTDSGNSHTFGTPLKGAANEDINIESNLTSATLRVTILGKYVSV